MSTPQPPRRRRIAGESKPGVPAPAPSVKRGNKLRPTSKPKTQKASTPKPPAPEAPSRRVVPEVPPAAAAPSSRRFRVPRVSGRLGALVALTVAAVAFGAVFGIRGLIEWRVREFDAVPTLSAELGEPTPSPDAEGGDQ